jgi:C-terminal processing protease CtpA/Prc
VFAASSEAIISAKTAPGVFVKDIVENGSAAHGGLKQGDRILTISGQDMSDASIEHALKVIKESGDSLTLEVQDDTAAFKTYQARGSIKHKVDAIFLVPLSVRCHAPFFFANV